MLVKDYTLIELSLIGDEQFREYLSLGLVMKPKDNGLPKLTEWEWGKIKEIQLIISSGITIYAIAAIIEIATGEKNIMTRKWTDVFPFFNYIRKGLDEIAVMEDHLAYEPTIYEMSAGIEEFNKFGYFVTVDRLAGGDPLKYDEIVKQPYQVIYSKLLLNKTDAEFTERYQKIMMNKYK